MHDQLKKRLIGGAVLVALAVIFLPMLLEEESPLDQGFSDPAIPPQGRDAQGFESRTLALPGTQGDAPSGIEPLIEPPPVFIPAPESDGVDAAPSTAPLAEPEPIRPILPRPEPVVPAQGQAAARPSAQPEPETGPEPEPAPQPAAQTQPKPKPKPEPRPTPKPVPKPAPKPAPRPAPKPLAATPDGGWVIQVASVTNEIRAKQLAVKLRARDYPAFVETAEVDGRTWYRVRVGPGQDAGRMNALLSRLQSDALVEGMDPKVISNH
ncbi:SPOR domain-containing protein [Magnetovirga frankeli]|uniref:SPOR domain-containing protein n=1 Tax=Magnetovirga frankeli TaxID=947516 RepID=UPI001293E917|nr:SPOR domain-containing protein [gamma proteobacterium SS-5]